MTSTQRAGYAFAMLEILAVGLVPAFSKFASDQVDPLLYGVVASAVAAFVACALAAGRGELGQAFAPGRLAWLVPIALSGTTATTLLLLYGARMTDGVSTALLLQAEPVYSLVLAAIVLGQVPPRRQVGGTALILAGILCVLWNGSLRVGTGGALILLAPLGWQLSHVLALRVMPPMSPYALTAARYVYGGAGLLAAQLLFGRSGVDSLTPKILAMGAFHGLVLFFCGTLFWYETIRRIDLAKATALVTPCEPLISVLLVWGMLGSRPTGAQALGMTVLLAGILILVEIPFMRARRLIR